MFGLRKSVRGKLLLTFVAIAVLPLMVATGIAVVRLRQTMAQRAGADRALMADQAANWLDRIIYERALDVQQLGTSPELVAAVTGMADPASTQAVLASATQRSGLLRAILVYDPQGGLVASSGEEAAVRAERNVASAEWFRAALRGEGTAYVGPVERLPGGAQRVMLASAIRSGDDNMGVVVADLDWARASQTVLGYIERYFAERGSETVRAYVVDPEGVVVGARDADRVLRASIAGSRSAAGLAQGRTGSEVEELFGEGELLVAYGVLDNAGESSGWYRGFMGGKAGVVITQRAEEAFSDAGSLMWQMVVLALVAAGVVAWLAWVVSGRLARPLVLASEVAERLALGDADQEVADPGTQDETGRLAKSLSELVGYMRELTAAAERMAAGDTHLRLVPKSEKDQLSKAFNTVATVNAELVAEVGRLTEAGKAGRLEVRGDVKKFEGGYRELVEGINATLDAVVEPIGEALRVLERVAERDLTVRMEGEYRGDFSKLKESLNTAVRNLEEALGEASASAEQVASAGQQISRSSQVLARGAGEQASSLEEVSASLQELASMARQNAGNAKEARSLSEGARESSRRGVESMERLSAAVERIKGSADATAKIIKTIDEIAFQTNLLALNAAVEAARAGEAGKGFAVVAEEVRSLAMRSAEAAKNTAVLIEESVRNAESGVELNREVLARLEEIAQQVDRVGEVMAEIAAASEQQSEGVEQISRAVEQMNVLTQQTAASSEESASAAEELSVQAERMRNLIAEFRLSITRPSTATQPTPASGVAAFAPAEERNGRRGRNGRKARRFRHGARAAGDS